MSVERLRVLVATGFGAGRLPLAPGSAGAAWGVGLAWALFRAGGHGAVLAGLFFVTAAGLWAAAEPERRFGRADPGCVVIDEIAGQMLALCFLVPGAVSAIAGFALFRLFDIAKPYPIRRLEALPGSSGIMADDLLAGIYANLAQQLLQRAFPSWWAAT